MKKKRFFCPNCYDSLMEYREIPKDKKMDLGTSDFSSHMWICTKCPMVLFEYWDYTDSVAVTNYLDHRLNFKDLAMAMHKLNMIADIMDKDNILSYDTAVYTLKKIEKIIEEEQNV